MRIEIEDSGVRFFVEGRFRTLNRPTQLSFTWNCSTWSDPSLESVVTVDLESLGDDRTFMTIEHALLPPDLIEQHRRGWFAIADQLDGELRRSAGVVQEQIE
jgi:uncharacterized protein YndB with AHSA1/START domain